MNPYFRDEWLTVYGGDCRAVLRELPAASVHCVVTSPPYWGLRDYGTTGQLGLEPTPEQYVAALVDVFREVRRVLRDDGTVWLNLGDSYAAERGGTHQPAETLAGGRHGKTVDGERVNRGRADGYSPTRNARGIGLKHKDLVGIPWRVAFALQADGWYLRSDIIWSKPNPMPESVTDRPTKSHEYLFLLSKSARYFYDAAAVAEPATYSGPNGAQHSPYGQGFTRRSDKQAEMAEAGRMGGFNDRWDAAERARARPPTAVETVQIAMDAGLSVGPDEMMEFIEANNRPPTWAERKAAGATAGNIGVSDTYQNGVHGEGLSHDLGDNLSRNLRSVWTIATAPYPGAHFATFPPKLVEPCIKAGTSERGVCPECGAPWVRVVERGQPPAVAPSAIDRYGTGDAGVHRKVGGQYQKWLDANPSLTTGWRPTCKHDAEPVPAVVLDPFAGTGTVGLVAAHHSRRAVLIDLKPDYLRQCLERNRQTPLGLPA